MKKIVIVVLMLCLKQFVLAQNDTQNMAATMQKQQPVIYTCPMHPEIHASKPGNCPKCGMKLVKEKPKAVPKKAAGMQISPKDPAKKIDNMGGMKMDTDDKNGMNMEGMAEGNADAENRSKAKANLGAIKT
jgi:DNA-directed RNA polymerase subunit RPC12/RpoP